MNEYDGPMYIVEDAVEYIVEATGVNEEIVRGVLEAEDDYMRSIGIIED